MVFKDGRIGFRVGIFLMWEELMFDISGVVVREVLVGGVLFVRSGLFFVCVHLTLKAVW
jgi:hypothetical protein